MTAALDAALAAFSDELARWGARMNLVGSTNSDAIRRHVEDSLAAAAHLPPEVAVVDLGSGAGFPGIPLAIARPDLRLTLVEIRERRVAFLRHVARELGLSIEIRPTSIEAPSGRDFDFALLRAVAKPERSLQLGLPWVRPSGEVWIWSGPAAERSRAGEFPLESGGRILRFRAADL
ncbi:MAG TPA: 16S rRNA (guanine(527)-N(7))-methyltransferase RsmG, partial [Myxococcota bacterium]|nr:16S rRNA (guanine(527)-N(7))-methyltransferase RsmG [Myxococcota bacterium]